MSPLLLRAELRRLHPTGRAEAVVLVLAVLDHRDEHVALVRLCGALLRLEDLLETTEGASQVLVVSDRRSMVIHGLHVDAVALRVRPDELRRGDACLEWGLGHAQRSTAKGVTAGTLAPRRGS